MIMMVKVKDIANLWMSAEAGPNQPKPAEIVLYSTCLKIPPELSIRSFLNMLKLTD